MFLAPVLTVIRASGFGLAFGGAGLLIGSCTVLPNEGETLRVKRVEEAVLPMAKVALEAEQTETAKRLYLRLLEVDPRSVTARMGLGDIAVARRDSTAAARWYAAAVAIATEADERHAALLAHGRAALAGGELEAARKSFSRLASERENAPVASVAWGLNGLGLIALLEGDIRTAIGFMERAVLFAPEDKMLADNLERALDLSAGLVAETERLDRVHDMAVAPAAPPVADPAPVAPAPPLAAPVAPPPESGPGAERSPQPTEPAPMRGERADDEGEVVEDRAREPPVPESNPESEEGGGPEQRPGTDRARTDALPMGWRVDRSELRPYAIKVDGEYYVRIGAYDLRAAADTVVSELRGVTAETVEVAEFGRGGGGNAIVLYRILVGPITSKAGLIELIATLDDLGYGAARLPPSVAAESRPAVSRAPAPPHRETGPELQEVVLESDRGETDATAAAPQQARLPPAPEPEDESGDAVSGEVPAPGETPSEEVPEAVAASPPARSMPGSGAGEESNGGVSGAAPPADETESREDAAATHGAADSASRPVNRNENLESAPRYLQVGAYTVRSTAQALAAEIRGVVRAPSRVVEAELANGETMYRVQVGPVGSDRVMAELTDMLVSRGYGTVRVLPESRAVGAEEVDSRQSLPSASPQRRVKAFIVSEDDDRFLQMGAYAVRSTADTLAAQLRLIVPEPVFVVAARIDDGGYLYRVRIGPIGSDDALAALLDVIRSSYGTGWLLPSIGGDRTRTAFIAHEDAETFLQVGAFAVRSAADALASELRGQVDGEIRVTGVSNGNGAPIFRVRIGPIASEDSLSALVEAMESLGYMVD
ncbi:MAG: SPOR domain-containing protein [Gammaproteobacteria bacterium]|nr:SPOR domain-containing protein [Gammaproteobacteria bacterium]